ncbi:uncharacterized protein LOC111296674 [Durio zibethinus]|uniref:Uncharacterized protein LOC111296674 n=1 Tax=Durio zibethinus TaxID=66656 RepID=A0A6P5Z2N2_DURZI|nr:uncharacterized protein LOC111296674 [Durio zibethinus]
MERKGLVLCSVVAFLAVLVAATGFAAEATRIKASEVKFVSTTQCSYPRSPALGLGLTAAAALLIAQIIINFATGCICCKRNPQTWNSNWTKALVFYVVSWFTFVIAFLLLLTGSALNDQHGEESVYFGNYYCYVVKPGVFAGGAVLAVASVIFGIFYYLSLNMAKNATGPWGNAPIPNQGGIAMGQPQFPPQSSQDPVFVHEDTYNRRQFT